MEKDFGPSHMLFERTYIYTDAMHICVHPETDEVEYIEHIEGDYISCFNCGKLVGKRTEGEVLINSFWTQSNYEREKYKSLEKLNRLDRAYRTFILSFITGGIAMLIFLITMMLLEGQ